VSEFGPVLTAAAVRDLEKIAPKTAEPLLAFIFGGLADNPRRRGKPLERELGGLWSARRGDYRVIYRLDDEAKSLFVLRIAHRSRVYRPR
jgi:mRNA interferase RelE/StbE